MALYLLVIDNEGQGIIKGMVFREDAYKRPGQLYNIVAKREARLLSQYPPHRYSVIYGEAQNIRSFLQTYPDVSAGGTIPIDVKLEVYPKGQIVSVLESEAGY